MSESESRLAALGLSLPAVGKPLFNYVPFRRAGDVAYLSGQVPRHADGSLTVGKVGAALSVEDARKAAELCGLHLLAIAREAAGSLEKVEFLKLFGMVNAVPEFGQQPKVIDACSDLLVAVLGERGRHARSAIGMGSLPSDVPVEIEAVIRILD
ncbi:RidA family protein [Pseudoroseomonas cervicalis]|uniref:RidA family protein n=1 Tax=Teichococcus cervicalis TaxID=204525 RepID=UPI00278A963F|nr:RidA family protein [Pseudoroseomonas cervicalis]MDQ1080109.1 enamine deaminase RidA (YjgF/YER057c/UK114 family) [Pseudoroseomonas cervicalis]